MNKIFTIICLIIFSFIIGFLFGYIYKNNKNIILEKDISIDQLSGEEIKHRDFKQNEKHIIFKTIAHGKGAIETTINKNVIDEVKYWNEKNNVFYLDYSIGIEEKYYGISYYKRFGFVMIGVGVYTNKSIKFSSGVMF